MCSEGTRGKEEGREKGKEGCREGGYVDYFRQVSQAVYFFGITRRQPRSVSTAPHPDVTCAQWFGPQQEIGLFCSFLCCKLKWKILITTS